MVFAYSQNDLEADDPQVWRISSIFSFWGIGSFAKWGGVVKLVESPRAHFSVP